MALKSIKGGFKLAPEDQRLVNTQRAITKEINEKFIQVGAIYLKPADKHPIDKDWYAKLRGDVDLQSWIDSEEHQPLNVGFNLQFGWMDIDIDTDPSDPEYARAVVAALDYLSIDTRFKFGRKSAGVPSHVLVQLGEDESSNFAYLRKFEPQEIRLNNGRYRVELRSFPTGIEAKNLESAAKQTAVPGSVLIPNRPDSGEYDINCWYGSSHQLASNISQIASTTPRRTAYTEVLRAVAFGTIAYLLEDHWTEGQRQQVAVKVTGWLARLVKDSEAINEHEVISKDVFCPVDNDQWAEKLLHFICDYHRDEEKHMRTRAYFDAREKLERNPDAKVPGWHSMVELVGSEAVQAMRTVLLPGSDVSKLSLMAERYIYDETDNKYIDRTRHSLYGNYVHEGSDLERRHKGDTMFVGGKVRQAFHIFESSNLRKRVGVRDMFPDLEPGAIYRVDVMGNVVPDESELASLTVFNTWKGWPIQPVAEIDDAVMGECVAKLDTLLGLLTQDKPEQIDWVKKWLSWTFQHPGDKQQIAWVCVGGMGVGKSFFGNTFMRALLTDRLWGAANPKILEGTFTIGPFKDKMFVFIDEAKFHGEQGTDEIKKLIRNVNISGMEKFEEARDYKIYARLMFAANQFQMNIGQRDVKDRALFYTRAYDEAFKEMTESEFREWTLGLKPFFDEFQTFLRRQEVVEHYMRYFMDLECNRHEIESIKLSSSGDADIIASNISWPRRIAKSILESGWVVDESIGWDSPFTQVMLNQRVQAECKEQGMPGINAMLVLKEFKDSGLIDLITEKDIRLFKCPVRWADAVARYERATGLELSPYRVFTDDDRGPNTTNFSDKIKRVGGKAQLFQKM